MYSSSKGSQSSTSRIAVSMFLNALRRIAWAREMVVWSVDTLIPVMRNPEATFASMQRYAGERKLLPQPTTRGMFELLVKP